MENGSDPARQPGRRLNCGLSPRELEVLRLIWDGYSSKEIASQLRVKFKTVATHRDKLHEKAGVHSTVHLLRWALKRGLISL